MMEATRPKSRENRTQGQGLGDLKNWKPGVGRGTHANSMIAGTPVLISLKILSERGRDYKSTRGKERLPAEQSPIPGYWITTGAEGRQPTEPPRLPTSYFSM